MGGGKRRVPGLSEASVKKETTRPRFVPVTAATRVGPQERGAGECIVVEATHEGSSANAASKRAQLLPPLAKLSSRHPTFQAGNIARMREARAKHTQR